MKIDMNPFADAHDLFYDKQASLLEPVFAKDDTGHVNVTHQSLGSLLCNIQPSSSAVMQREFGKLFTDSQRMSFNIMDLLAVRFDLRKWKLNSFLTDPKGELKLDLGDDEGKFTGGIGDDGNLEFSYSGSGLAINGRINEKGNLEIDYDSTEIFRELKNHEVEFDGKIFKVAAVAFFQTYGVAMLQSVKEELA